MKQRKLVVDHVRIEHRLFRSSRKCQSPETGSYTVTASSENARFQWLLRYITAVKAAGFQETLYQVRNMGEKRGPMYHINKYINKQEMCSVSTNGERASPAQQGSQLIGCHLSYLISMPTFSS